jgi:tetratricopeptide (TPR) repeat protein
MSRLYRNLIHFSCVVTFLIQILTTQAFAAPSASAQTSTSDFFKSGVEKIQNGDWKQALVEFTQAIELNAEKAAAYGNRCLVYIQLGEYLNATDDCTQALQLKPNNASSVRELVRSPVVANIRASAYLNRGLAYHRQARYQEAIADFNQTIKIKPIDYSAYYNRGLARFEQEDYEEAIADFNQALQQIPTPQEKTLATVYNDRGLTHFQLRNISAAIADFSLAIRLNGSDARAYYNRGCICHRQGDYVGAIRDFTLSIQRSPNRAEAYVNRGIARYQLGYQQAAFEDLQKGAECFCAQKEMVAYQQTLNLIKKIQQQSPSTVESETA